MRNSVCIAAIVLFGVSHAIRGEVYAPPVDVELLVRAPDGKPAANTKIVVKVPDPFHSDDKPDPPKVSAKTDAKGVAHFKFPGGQYTSLAIDAESVGYGNIGIVDFAWGEVAHPYLPPLAAYAAIEGTIPVEANIPGVLVSTGYAEVSKPDANGHFKIGSLHARAYEGVIALEGKSLRAGLDRKLLVVPGQTIRGLELKAIKATAEDSKSNSKEESNNVHSDEQKETVWVRGTVLDEAKKPIAGATVFVFGQSDGGFRTSYIIRKETTDAEGHYEVKGPGGLSNFSARMLVISAGHLPVESWPAFPRMMGIRFVPENDAKRDDWPPPFTEDFILPSRGGALEVTVMENGKPVAGATVTVESDIDFTFPQRGFDQDALEQIDSALLPTATTNADGIARIENLQPGRYRLLASKGDATHPRALFRPRDPYMPYAMAEQIPVSAGQTTTYRIGIRSQSYTANLRALHPDGSTISEEIAFHGMHIGSDESNEQTGPTYHDPSGISNIWLTAPGLWNVAAKYPSPRERFTNFTEPYFAVLGTVAGTEVLPSYAPKLAARWIEPPSVLVSVVDSTNKPIRAAVEIGRLLEPNFSGSTDENGRILFQGLPTDAQQLATAYVLDKDSLDVMIGILLNAREGDEPIPPESTFQNRFTIFPQPIDATTGRQTAVTLRKESVGFVTGKILAADGDDLKDYRIDIDPTINQPYAYCYARANTKEYIAGPFRAGPVRLISVRTNEKGGEIRTLSQTEVRGGELTHLDIKPAKPPVGPVRTLNVPERFMGSPQLFSEETAAAYDVLSGDAVLSDGITPAWPARILYLQVHNDTPEIVRTTDILGRFRPTRNSRSNNAGDREDPNGPREPVVVAYIPGMCGAAIVPPPERSDQPMHIVLPPAMALKGQVKIDGKVPSKINAAIRVKAGYQDKGLLNELLSLETTADVDGNFTLAGLTPGNYLVQATLDDIWLSPSTAIHVTDSDPKPIDLNIAAPGSPVVVKLVDKAGKPRVGETLTIDRPKGPLAEKLWPKEWISDGLGVINIPTLEAGKHVLHAANAAGPTTVTVPALPSKDAVEIKITLKDSLPGAKPTPLYTPREKLPEIPDRPADNPLRGKEADIRATVLTKVPIGTEYYLIRRAADREAWKEINFRAPGLLDRSGEVMNFELGQYKENGKTVTVVATIVAQRKGEHDYRVTEIQVDKAIDLKDN